MGQKHVKRDTRTVHVHVTLEANTPTNQMHTDAVAKPDIVSLVSETPAPGNKLVTVQSDRAEVVEHTDVPMTMDDYQNKQQTILDEIALDIAATDIGLYDNETDLTSQRHKQVMTGWPDDEWSAAEFEKARQESKLEDHSESKRADHYIDTENTLSLEHEFASTEQGNFFGSVCFNIIDSKHLCPVERYDTSTSAFNDPSLGVVYITPSPEPNLSQTPNTKLRSKWLDPQSQIDYLDISFKQLAYDEIVSVSSALSFHQHLEKLVLRFNDIGPHGIAPLAKALETNQVLLTLDLFSTKLGVVGARHLSRAIRHNKVLSDLDVGKNSLGSEGLNILNAGLKYNGSLLVIDVQHNAEPNDGLFTAEEIYVRGCLYRNKCLIHQWTRLAIVIWYARANVKHARALINSIQPLIPMIFDYIDDIKDRFKSDLNLQSIMDTPYFKSQEEKPYIYPENSPASC